MTAQTSCVVICLKERKGKRMFDISPGKIKNSIQKLDEIQKRLSMSRERLLQVYACMDSLVEGQMDKQAIRILAEQAQEEMKNTARMQEVLEMCLREYEKTEKKIMQQGAGIKKARLHQIDLTEIGQTLDDLGIQFK